MTFDSLAAECAKFKILEPCRNLAELTQLGFGLFFVGIGCPSRRCVSPGELGLEGQTRKAKANLEHPRETHEVTEEAPKQIAMHLGDELVIAKSKNADAGRELRKATCH